LLFQNYVLSKRLITRQLHSESQPSTSKETEQENEIQIDRYSSPYYLGRELWRDGQNDHPFWRDGQNDHPL